MNNDREARKAAIAAMLGIEPTREDPRADANPAYSRAPWVGLTITAMSIGGGWWSWGFGNYDGHYVKLFDSRQGPSDDYDPLPDIERAATRYVGTAADEALAGRKA